MRIYLPATLDELDGALRPRRAHAVTSALRAELPDEDDEGLEFAAQLAAAAGSLELIAASPDAPRLRLVVSADVPDAAVTVAEGAEPSAVDVGLVAPDAIACVHVDEPQARPDVERAIAGDADAAERLEEADLLWYDVSELRAIPR
ncbi:DUF6912 family protein [Cellulomonas massiliensis]|uniref:DUF6912 family protein n=1 Tax=Cellulomonas massiliensis TaxID=1465811 RepID=UPI0002DC8821|nr:hypothetical protein [Cellulomonas massiliensis]